MKWQPIDTFPKDGSDFLGYNGIYIDRTWCHCIDDEGNGVFMHQDYVPWYPTHWMPLPEPPTGE
jgi:hypothetical protein